MSTPGFQTLRQLHNIIGDSISQLESNFEAKSLDWPCLANPEVPDQACIVASAPDNVEAINKIVAAADQLTASVRGPPFTLFEASMAYYLSACLHFVEQTLIVEILREAGAQGLHVNALAARSKQDPIKLTHVMRLLATHHIFREVKPNIFANNRVYRVSSAIDTGKSSVEIFADPESKYDGTSGMAAFIDMAGDEMFKAAAAMTETYTDPKTKHSLQPSQACFPRAMNTNLLYFPWLEKTKRVRRFSVAMIGSSLWEAPDAILQGFPWGSLPNDSLMVDVGGGIGSLALKIVKAHPHIRMVVQDRPVVVALGERLWKAELPDALTSGRVKLQVHDFFEPQPCRDASVFLLRAISHDWPDAFVVKILKHLRDAALPHTRLVLGDHIIPYACPDDTDASELPGAAKSLAPAPLLANLGRASTAAYYTDMTMQTMYNGQERTLSHIVAVLAEAHWKVTNVHRVGDSRFGHITAVIL